MFISVEGIDGAGKTSLSKILANNGKNIVSFDSLNVAVDTSTMSAKAAATVSGFSKCLASGISMALNNVSQRSELSTRIFDNRFKQKVLPLTSEPQHLHSSGVSISLVNLGSTFASGYTDKVKNNRRYNLAKTYGVADNNSSAS